MSEEMAIKQNADGFFDIVPVTGLYSLNTSQKIDSLMEVKEMADAERFLELWKNAKTKDSASFILRLHEYEYPYNYRLNGPLLTKFMNTYV